MFCHATYSLKMTYQKSNHQRMGRLTHGAHQRNWLSRRHEHNTSTFVWPIAEGPQRVLHVDVIRCCMVAVTWDLPTLASSSFHARGQVTATVVSPFMVPSCGILCHTTCAQLTYPWPHSEIAWKHSCLMLTCSSAFAALANLGYTSDIILLLLLLKP